MSAPELDNVRLAQLAPAGSADGRGREVVFAVEGLEVAYGGVPALRDVTIDIRKNFVTAFIGPSGCGKSTLLRCFNRMNDLIAGATVTGSVRVSRRRPVRAERRPGRGATTHRHGVPEAEPVPEVDLRQRRLRAAHRRR